MSGRRDPLSERFAAQRTRDLGAAPAYAVMLARARVAQSTKPARFSLGFGVAWGGAAALSAAAAALVVVALTPAASPGETLYWSTPTDSLLELPASTVGTAWPDQGLGLLQTQLTSSPEDGDL